MMSIFLSLLMLSGAPAFATPWDDLLQSCNNVYTAGFLDRIGQFKVLTSEGKTWEREVEREKAAVDAVTDDTCKRWGASPNGHGHLEEFVKKYGDVSSRAISLEDKAQNYFVSNLRLWIELQRQEVSKMEGFLVDKVAWETEFPACAGAFAATVRHVDEQMKAVRAKFERLKKQCPGAADAAIREVASKAPSATAVNGSPQKILSGENQGRSKSDITGTKKKAPKLP